PHWFLLQCRLITTGGLHECTGDVLPPTSDCGEAVCCGGDGSICEGGVRRGCVPLARLGGTDRVAAIDATREQSEWRGGGGGGGGGGGAARRRRGGKKKMVVHRGGGGWGERQVW